MDRFEAMSVLVAIADGGSLSSASRDLGTPLATVSRKVAELEARLKTRLVNRSSRRITLTDAGLAYVASARRIIEQVEEAERTTMGEYSAPKGHLTVTAPVVFGRLHVLPVAADFMKAHPDISLRLMLADRLLDLPQDNVDVAIRIGPLPDSSLIATRVGWTRRVVCASPGYVAAHGRPKRPEDLTALDCITFENLASPRSWVFRIGREDRAVQVRSRLSVTTAEAAIDAAVAGLGLTRVLSYMTEDARRAGRLEILLEDFEPEAWPVSLVHQGHGSLAVKTRAFLDWAAPRLKSRLA